jgi:hypothetical protein
VIPEGTRSAMLAEKGITNEEEMANFLTVVFADTLNCKIIFSDLEQRLKQGVPIDIQAMGGLKEPVDRRFK